MPSLNVQQAGKLNIGFYRYSLYNRGGDRLIVAYANHLASRGHQVTLFSRVVDTVFHLSHQVIVRSIPIPGRAGTLMYGALHDLGQDVVIVDIIHLPLALSVRNRVLYYAQADDVEYYDGTVMRTIMDMLYRRYFRSDRPMISMSQHLTDIFLGRYRQVNSQTLKTGIDHEIFYPDPDQALMRSKGKKRAVLLLARGDAYRKGLDISYRVLSALNGTIAENIELWVCGNILDDRGYTFTVRQFGVVGDDRLRQLLSSADMLCYPSRHEGFGLFPLEAMACGCVAVTSEAVPYARSSQAILCSPIEDAGSIAENIAALVRDPELLARKKAAGIEEARLYDLNESKQAFETALLAVLANR